MPIATTAIDCQELEAGHAPALQRQLFAVWRKTRGVLTRDLLPLHDHLVMMSDRGPTALPETLYMGDRSLAKAVMGTGWQADLGAIAGHEDIIAGYQAAVDGEPVYQFVHFVHDLHPGKAIAYERLIVPFRTPKGIAMTATLSLTVNTDRSSGQHRSDRQDRPGLSVPSSIPVVLGRETPQSSMHWGSAA